MGVAHVVVDPHASTFARSERQPAKRSGLAGVLCLMLWSAPCLLWAADTCSECVLGIWDDPGLTQNFGEITAGQPKDLYVGIKFADGFGGLSGISLSIVGLRAFLLMGTETIVPTATTCDYLGAPADTSATSNAGGGCDFAWPACLTGDQALLRLTILSSGPVTNGLLQVTRHYPPWPPEVHTPIVMQCAGPTYTPTRVRGGSYILNWNGDPGVRVEGLTWSRVKQLHR